MLLRAKTKAVELFCAGSSAVLAPPSLFPSLWRCMAQQRLSVYYIFLVGAKTPSKVILHSTGCSTHGLGTKLDWEIGEQHTRKKSKNMTIVTQVQFYSFILSSLSYHRVVGPSISSFSAFAYWCIHCVYLSWFPLEP